MVWNVYAENNASRIQVLTTSSSQSLPQTAVCQPKPPAWSLAPTQVEKSWAAPFLHSQTPQPTKMVWGCTKEGISVPHCVSLRRNYPCHQKIEKRLCNGYCQVPLTCYHKNLHHGMTTNQYFCVWWSIVEPSALNVWPVSQAAGAFEKPVAHFWMSHLYYRCCHLHSSVVLCILRTVAFADS